jgi:hypothetical protein
MWGVNLTHITILDEEDKVLYNEKVAHKLK